MGDGKAVSFQFRSHLLAQSGSHAATDLCSQNKIKHSARIHFGPSVFLFFDEFIETGKVDNAAELTPLTGKFIFKAKMEYYGDIMYFYAFVHNSEYRMQAGLCLIYPENYSGTEDEKNLIKVLDAAAESFRRL